MATNLKNLKITKVDFVDAGANPEANVLLYKNKDGIPGGSATAGNVKEHKQESVLKRFFSAIGKAVGMKPEEIDTAVEEIEKGGAQTFGEQLKERNRRKINDEIWDICYALQGSLCSILYDEEVTNPQELMQSSIEQFGVTVTAAIPQWVSGNGANVIKKSTEAVTEEALSFMKYSKERLEGMIADAETGEMITKDASNGLTDNEELKGEEVDMSKVDKSKMTPAERAFFEDIEKRYAEADAGVGTGEGTEPENTVAKTAPTRAVTVPSAGDTPTVESEDIYKGLHPAVAEELKMLRKRADDAEVQELTAIAKKYEIIGKKSKELVPVLKSLKSTDMAAYDNMIAILDASVEAVNKSSMFTEIGKSGGYGNIPDSWTQIEKKADELQQADSNLNRVMAIDKACQLNPQLVHEYENEN